jgi:hypothetical protein
VNETGRGDGEGQEDLPKTQELQGVEGDGERVIVLERKLPGQDSNLDKENQNP